jgi:hypothetical protein
MTALQQCNLLTIEDIIRFLPDTSTIEDFSEEIQTCLEESNQRVDDLKWEMQQTTEAQERILKDIEGLEKKVLGWLLLFLTNSELKSPKLKYAI